MNGVRPVLSKALALGLLVAVPATMYLAVVTPLIERHRQYDAAIERSTKWLSRYRHVAVDKSSLELQRQELTRTESAYGGALQTTTDALAGAYLQSHVNKVIANTHSTIRSVQILPPENDGAFRKVGARVQVVVAQESLTTALYELEAVKPYLFLDSIEIQRTGTGGIPDRTGDGDSLMLRVDVYGYMRKQTQ
jgi:hypothetical protein